jgi:hypothetical protein
MFELVTSGYVDCMRSIGGALCAVVALAATLTGCAAGSGEQEAPDVVQRFFTALQHDDPTTACGLLTSQARQELNTSEGEGCPDALPADRLRGADIGEVDVWSGWARVLTDAGTVYLTQFDAGWRIAAAGCRSDGPGPDDCVLGG